MSKGEEFSIKLKMIFFRVIDFVEREIDGMTIPLHKMTARLIEMLGVKEASIDRLKNELAEQQQEQKNSKRLSIMLSPQPNLLQFPIDRNRSGVGHQLYSWIPLLLSHSRHRCIKQEILVVRHSCSPKRLRIRFDTSFT